MMSTTKGRKKKKGADDVNPKMQKIMKIMKIVVAVIIVFILVFAVGKAAGVFKGFGGITKEEETEGKVKVYRTSSV